MDRYLQQLEDWRSRQSGQKSRKSYIARQLGLPSVTNYTNWLRRGSLPKAYIEPAISFLRHEGNLDDDRNQAFLVQFRHAAPYIQSHRDRTFVVAMPGEVFDSLAFDNVIHDLSLLACLGVKLVIVHGARSQIQRHLESVGIKSKVVEQIRVTTDEELPLVVDSISDLTTRLISVFSTGMPNTPRFGVQLSVLSGNFIMARPMGVRYGVDFQHTGVVRQVQTSRIRAALDTGAIVIVPPLGYSLTGELFNLSMQEVVAQVSLSLGADKLICLTTNEVLSQLQEQTPTLIDRIRLVEAVNRLDEPSTILQSITPALLASGCRCHLIDFDTDGSLLQELYTPEGQGVMVVDEGYQQLRAATIEDIGGLLDLIRPLEDRGILVKRSRDLLEKYIDNYKVIEYDGLIVACGALIPFSNSFVELACIATHPGFSKMGLGKKLVDALVFEAKRQSYKKAFVLTTEGEHWFIEQKFREANLTDLPEERRQAYNYQRNSKVLIRNL